MQFGRIDYIITITCMTVNCHTSCKSSPILEYERWAWSWSRFLGSLPQVTLVINRLVGCHYFPLGTRLLSQPNRSLPLAATKLYCLATEVHMYDSLLPLTFMYLPIYKLSKLQCRQTSPIQKSLLVISQTF